MKKILIWGTGKKTETLLRDELMYANIVGFIETQKTKTEYKGFQVYASNELPESFDYILVPTVFSDEIYDECVRQEITLNRVIFLEKLNREQKFKDYAVVREIFGETYFAKYCSIYSYAAKVLSFDAELEKEIWVADEIREIKIAQKKIQQDIQLLKKHSASINSEGMPANVKQIYDLLN